jgi:hypothetical protein
MYNQLVPQAQNPYSIVKTMELQNLYQDLVSQQNVPQ